MVNLLRRAIRGVTQCLWAMICLFVIDLPPTALTKEEGDFLGSRFRCYETSYDSKCMQLSILKKECTLQLHPGGSIPPELTEKVMLQRPNELIEVRRPKDLVGCVNIDTSEAALEFLRFFSSFRTVHLFDEQTLEVFQNSASRKCQFVCLDKYQWKKLKLESPIIASRGENFQITRFIIKPIPSAWIVSLYRRVEIVEKSGRVEIISETKIDTDKEDLNQLNFPMFL